ncbi:Dolichyldiphosphatase 1, partial [Termitomyces sp. J132]
DNDESLVSLSLALITLSPILLMASYAALAVQSREYIIIVMWAGQLASEGFNWLLKHVMKEARPGGIGNGYGFPSSHSQYMAYFGSFLMCHMYFRHRFATTGVLFFDQLWRTHRYYLGYHSTSQVLWGVGIGILLGISLYVVAELIPRKRPFSILGKTKRALLSHPLSQWFRIRDGWAVWTDGGREGEWTRWRNEWERRQITHEKRLQ